MTEGRKGGKDNGGKILHFAQDPSFFAKRGDARRAQNDLLSAVSLYNEALLKDPHDLDTRLAAAEILTDMSRFNDSNRMLIPYMHEDEDFKKDAWCMVGFNLMGLGEFDGAKAAFDRFFSMTDEVSERTDAILDALDYIDSLQVERPLLADAAEAERESRIFEAQQAFDSGDFEKSTKLYKKLVQERPDEARLLYDAALSCLCGHDEAAGEELINRLIANEPQNWAALSLKLLYVKASGNDIESESICRRLEKCDSDQPEELLRVNGALIETGHTAAALKSALRLVKLLPYDQLTNHRLAICYVKQKQYKKAAEIYDKLLKIDRGDSIARFYRAECIEAENGSIPQNLGAKPMIQYQLPFEKIIERAKQLMLGREITAESLRDKWENDAEFRDTVRWAFTLHEFNISYAMLNLLRAVWCDSAEHLVRSVMADADVSRSIVNEAMGILKRMDAQEPFYAMLDGSLLEGRVNIVDISNVRIPRQYRLIFERFRESAGELYSREVINAAAGIVERFIANTGGEFKKISREQSEALSAAVEYLACDQCGVPAKDDALERYGVTEHRLMNALNVIVSTVVNGAVPKNNGGDDE